MPKVPMEREKTLRGGIVCVGTAKTVHRDLGSKHITQSTGQNHQVIETDNVGCRKYAEDSYNT